MMTILILEQGHANLNMPGSEMRKLLLGKGAGVLGQMKTSSGHVALKVDEYGATTEDTGSMSFTIADNPQCEDDPLLVKEASGPEPAVVTPAMSDAHTYMVSQDTKGIGSSINEE
eukprot:9140026-Pyramimonas_sp.AAC.1